MKILAVECSATAASCAVLEDGHLTAHHFVNTKTTHSETLMKMVKDMLNTARINVSEIDRFAVSAGPGSFTGVRIGIAAVKGLAAAKNTPCVSVSSLEAMAYCHKNINGIFCCVMDARCKQVYNAIFEISGGEISRLCEDRAISCEDLAKELQMRYNKREIIIIGDGVDAFMPFAKQINAIAENDVFRHQSAVGVALAAQVNACALHPNELTPIYLRLPQAERELKAKQERK